MKTILTKNQKKKETFKNLTYQGEQVDLTVNIRYDDDCNNGHNTFSITGELYKAGRRGDRNLISCGCIHDVIEELAPQYEPFIKWHLMSSDKPMHYVANTMYHAKKIEKYTNYVYLKDSDFKFNTLLGIYSNDEVEALKIKYGTDHIKIETKPHYSNKESNLKAARSTALAPNATLEQLQNEQWLIDRLPKLKEAFKNAMEQLGFVY